jgi:hypothetical protein
MLAGERVGQKARERVGGRGEGGELERQARYRYQEQGCAWPAHAHITRHTTIPQ